jgi:magnesium transporter
VVDDYERVMREVDNDIEEIELQVFSTGATNQAQRIYELKRELTEFRRAVLPLREPLRELMGRRVPLLHELVHPGTADYFRDVHDHVTRVSEQIEAVDGLLSDALAANLADAGIRQNEDMRKISAWVAIAAVPTMIAGIYGMNFQHMPELGWKYGYFFALAIMGGSCAFLYRLFKRNNWL